MYNALDMTSEPWQLDGTNYTAAAGTSDALTSDPITVDAEVIDILTMVGTVTTTGTVTIKIQQCDTSGGSYADLEGTSQLVSASAMSNTLVHHRIIRPREGFLKVVCTRATANAVILSQCVIKRGLRKLPPSTPTGSLVETHGSPAEGTA